MIYFGVVGAVLVNVSVLLLMWDGISRRLTAIEDTQITTLQRLGQLIDVLTALEREYARRPAPLPAGILFRGEPQGGPQAK